MQSIDKKYIYMNTIGCQMNVYDSERIIQSLQSLGYIESLSLDMADLIIVNTCTIRAKAEQKAFSFLGRLAKIKKKKPGIIIGVGGCMAQQEGKNILERVPFIDIVFGTHAVERLPRHIEKIASKRYRVVDVEMTNEIEELEHKESIIPKQQVEEISRFLTIMRGCDNYCTYCVVPYVRGREISRDPVSIVKEARKFVKTGVKEIFLLGQNVNSYGKKEELCSFHELLSRVNNIEGLLRIRFTTSHPKDLTEDLMRAFANLDKLCHHIHLPVQSGSNDILKKMNRKYTRERYVEKINQLRNICPEIAVTSDIIVGFPGETEDDFGQTLELIKLIEYDGLFAFQYSDRPNASASGLPDKISEKTKRDRLNELLEFQGHITKKKNRVLIGTDQEVLVEGFSKKELKNNTTSKGLTYQLTGRTPANKIVNFVCDDKTTDHQEMVGQVASVRIEKAFSHSLWGKLVKNHSSLNKLKGEKSYAA
ncbi:MAG: tRNA (N6-isopentenyl adenosine(37)-C2)-methylthiotransferase MiaB [Deltaproteobacteria bacterium]|nr:tRNA (N6-isopentenyl adenosine(37)-C2)-methylthiotransferase MiaB [Deltaproteobacteria bacterium]